MGRRLDDPADLLAVQEDDERRQLVDGPVAG